MLLGTGKFNWAELAEATAPAKRGTRSRRSTTKTYATKQQQQSQHKHTPPEIDPSAASAIVNADLKAGSGYRASIASVGKRAGSASVGIAAVGSVDAEPAYEPRAADPDFLMPVNPEVTGERGWGPPTHGGCAGWAAAEQSPERDKQPAGVAAALAMRGSVLLPHLQGPQILRYATPATWFPLPPYGLFQGPSAATCSHLPGTCR